MLLVLLYLHVSLGSINRFNICNILLLKAAATEDSKAIRVDPLCFSTHRFATIGGVQQIWGSLQLAGVASSVSGLISLISKSIMCWFLISRWIAILRAPRRNTTNDFSYNFLRINHHDVCFQWPFHIKMRWMSERAEQGQQQKKPIQDHHHCFLPTQSFSWTMLTCIYMSYKDGDGVLARDDNKSDDKKAIIINTLLLKDEA